MSRSALSCKPIRTLCLIMVALMFAHFFAPCVKAQEQTDPAKREELLINQPRVEPRDLTYTASRLTLYGGVAADLGTTWYALSRGHVEANPILGQSRVRQGVIVIGSAVMLDFVSRKLHRSGHTKVAKVLNFIIGGEHLAAATHNYRQITR